MNVTLAAAETEVLRLYSQYRVRAGGRLGVADLKAQWPACGLRATDLDAAINGLVFSGALRWVETEEGAGLELTPSGDWQRLQRPALSRAALRGWWNQLRKVFTTGTMHSAVDGPHQRRRGDPPIRAA